MIVDDKLREEPAEKLWTKPGMIFNKEQVMVQISTQCYLLFS
jgi:hypothetical protein